MQLPCTECKGRCCTFPVFSPIEFKSIRYLVKLPPETTIRPIEHVKSYNPSIMRGDVAVVLHMADGTCPFLGDKGCKIFHMRPKVCRDYGVVPDLPCEYLYPKEAEAKQMERIRRSR